MKTLYLIGIWISDDLEALSGLFGGLLGMLGPSPADSASNSRIDQCKDVEVAEYGGFLHVENLHESPLLFILFF